MVRTQVFKSLQIGALALLVLAFAIGAAGVQTAQAAGYGPFHAAMSRWLPAWPMPRGG